MGIINRDMHSSQQMDMFTSDSWPLGISTLIQIGIVPYNAQLMKVVSIATGVSNTPILGMQIVRFITGVGQTTINLNGSSLLTISAYSVSGMQTHAVPPIGSTLGILQAGDVLQYVSSGVNSYATYTLSWVLQCLQDYKTQYGLGVGS